MSVWLRRAGRGRDGSGAWVTWTMATGRRGRRWREVRVSADGDVVSSLLLETDAERRFSHMELSTAAGLLTLHPEGDATLHGNVVASDGVRHLRGLPWSSDGVVLVEGSTIATAAAVQLLGTRVGVGERATASGVAIDLDLRVAAGPSFDVRQEDGGAWRLRDGPSVTLDGEGLPVLQNGAGWPLETE
jgi:hypothetical protein